MHEYWTDGFLPEQFNVLRQKGSQLGNVELAEGVSVPTQQQQVRGGAHTNSKQNVLRLHAHANRSSTAKIKGTGALVQTAALFSSGFFEIKARLPAVQGMVFALWTFHYETHRPSTDPLLHNQTDNQYVCMHACLPARTHACTARGRAGFVCAL